MKSAFILLFALLSFGSFAQTTPAPAPAPADAVLKEALAQAKKEHKDVILMFHASWCGWCKKMTACFEDPSCAQFFNDNYVITYIDVLERGDKVSLENAGGLDVLKQYKGDPTGGIPYWIVMDAKGNAIGTSYMPHADGTPGTAKDNVGCPAEDNEVAYFTSLIKSTSKLTDDQLAVIRVKFSKNKPASTSLGN